MAGPFFYNQTDRVFFQSLGELKKKKKIVTRNPGDVGERANLARVHWRRWGRSPTCVSKLNECTEKDECTEIVSGKVSRASTQELIIYKKGGQTTRKSALKCAGSSRYLQKKMLITM